MRILLRDLQPGTTYSLQLRANDGSGRPSEWSKVFALATTSDTIAPATPANVIGSMSGTAFQISWDAVTLSSDGSSAYDLDRYEVKVESAGTATNAIYAVKDTKFFLELGMNRAIFTSPRANIKMSVRAVDKTGNASPYSSIIDQTNPAPANPANFSAVGITDAVVLKWDAVADTDLTGYRIYSGTTAGTQTTLVWSGGTTSATLPSTAYGVNTWYKVSAVDVFGTESVTPPVSGPVSPNSPFTVDTTPPAVPTGLAAVLTTAADTTTSAAVSWTAVADPTGDLAGYQIGYRPVGAADWSYTTVDYTLTSTRIDRLTPYVNYDFRIRSYDWAANYSAWSSTVTTTTAATNTAPAAPTGLVFSGGIQTATITWTENTELDVKNGAGMYEVQLATDSGFTLNLKTVKTAATVAAFANLTRQTTYYARIRAVDSLGLAGSYSSTVSGSVGAIPGPYVISTTAPTLPSIGDVWYDQTANAEKMWNGSAWVITGNASNAYVQARATDLVTNGSAIMGSNYNFPGFDYNGADAPTGANGSFVIKTTANQSAFISEFITFDPTKQYKFSFQCRQTVTGQTNTMYGFIAPFDISGNQILPQSYMYVTGTTTTLAAPLNPGDTTITLTSSANWYGSSGKPAGASTYLRSLIFWDYVDSTGKAWPVGSYSRNNYLVMWADGGITGNVITLSAPWAGPAKAAGTSVSNGTSGGAYMYMPSASNVTVPETWTAYSDIFSAGVMSAASQAVAAGGSAVWTGGVPPGTAKIQVGWLLNYPAGGTGKHAIAAVSLSDASAALAAAQAAQATATTAQTTANGKNKVTYSLAAPGSTANTAGDIWFQKNASEIIIGQWEGTGGTSWVAKTIDNVVIANLDAAKITTGTLAAGRIGASTITADKLSVTAGGGNRLKNSSFEYDSNADGTCDGFAAYTFGTVTLSNPATGYNGGKAQRVTNASAANATVGISTTSNQIADWTPLQTYVITVKARADSAKAYGLRIAWNTAPTTTNISNPNLTTSYQLYAWRIVWGASVEASQRAFLAGNGTMAVGEYIEFDEWSITEGDVVPQYSPNVTELLPGTIQATHLAAGSVTTNSMAANSITGDRIQTNTLSGDRIIANSLDANTIKANTTFTNALNVKTTFTLGDASTDGSIQSFDYGTGTGFKLAKSGLIINQGSIAAAALNIQSGTNLVPAEYASFEFVPSFYTGKLTTTGTNTIVSSGAKFGTQYLQSRASTAATFGVSVGISSTDYNIPVDPNTNYIVSAWVKTGSVATNFDIKLRFSNGVYSPAVGVTTLAASGAWQRVYGVVTIPSSGVSAVMVVLESNTATIGAGFDVDGIQVEQQIGAAITPSTWTMPGITSIDAGIIRTGQIQSTSTTTVNSVVQPAWSINMSGNAQFGDALIRGKLLVGPAGADVDAGQSYIASGNFVASTTGWKIDSSGYTEFNSGIYRGTLGANIVTASSMQAGAVSADKIAVGVLGRNFLKDPSFEEEYELSTTVDQNKWYIHALTGTGGAASKATSLGRARSGMKGLYMKATAGGGTYIKGPVVAVVPGKTYNFSANIASTSNGGNGIYLRMAYGATTAMELGDGVATAGLAAYQKPLDAGGTESSTIVLGPNSTMVKYASFESFGIPLAPSAAFDVASYSVTTNVVTINTTDVHGLIAGDWITISGVLTGIDGLYQVATAPTTTSITVSITTPDQALVNSDGFINKAYISLGTTYALRPDDFYTISASYVAPAGTNYFQPVFILAPGTGGYTAEVVVDDVAITESGYPATEVTAAGVRLFNEFGTEVGAFVSNRTASFSVSSGTKQVASISNDGAATFQTIQVVGKDTDGDGTPETGLNIYGTEFKDWIWNTARGTVAAFTHDNKSQAGITSRVSLGELSFTPVPGRRYRINVSGLQVASTVANDRAIMTIRATRDDSTPQVSSTILDSAVSPPLQTAGSVFTIPNIDFTQVFGPPISSNGASLSQDWTPTGPLGLIRILLCLERYTGTGSISYNTQLGGTQFKPLRWEITDVGPDCGDIYWWHDGGSGGTASTVVSKKTYTTTWVASSSATYKGSGVKRTDTTDMVQGYDPSGYNGNGQAIVFFGAANSKGDEVGKTLVGATSGSTINKIEVYLYANSWYYNSGGTAKIGYYGGTSAPATFTGAAPYITSSSWPKPGGRWVNISSTAFGNAIKAGTATGVTLGATSLGTNLAYYGRFSGAAAAANKPQIRITYTK